MQLYVTYDTYKQGDIEKFVGYHIVFSILPLQMGKRLHLALSEYNFVSISVFCMFS
jgi:hypothetical protein